MQKLRLLANWLVSINFAISVPNKINYKSNTYWLILSVSRQDIDLLRQ